MVKWRYIPVLFLFIVLSCKTRHEKERAYTKPYHKESNELKIQLFLHHDASNTSSLYYRLDNSQLLYKKLDTAGHFSARLKFSYKFTTGADARQVLDSGTVFIEDKNESQAQGKIIAGYFPLRLADGQESYLEMHVEDILGKRSHTRYIHCNKKTAYSQQNFLVKNINKEMLFTNKIEQGNIVYISNNRTSFVKARIDFFATDYSLPPPPFSQKEPALYPSTPDSTAYISSIAEHDFSFKMQKQGIYFIRLDSVNAGGCTVLCVEQNFPKVQSHAQMVASSR
jgi:hypothetical protein